MLNSKRIKPEIIAWTETINFRQNKKNAAHKSTEQKRNDKNQNAKEQQNLFQTENKKLQQTKNPFANDADKFA